jgi:type IV pilus assembly protein PilM
MDMDNLSLKKIITEGFAGISKVIHSSGKSDSAIGVDIGSSAIKVVQLKKKGGKAILETYGAISLGPYAGNDIGTITNLQSDDLSKALIDLMKESNVTVKSGVMAIPSLASLIFTISLPDKIKEDQLSSIIPIEARKYIPVPISEVTLDWTVIPQEPEYYNSDDNNKEKENPLDKKEKKELKTEVLVIAIHNETLSRYQEILKKTGINSNSFEIEIFGNIRASFSRDLTPVLLIDFGASKTKLSIVETGVVRVFHVVNRGSSDITRNISQVMSISFTEAEKLKRSIDFTNQKDMQAKEVILSSINYIFSDINNVVFAFEKKYNKTISKVILTGGGSLLNGLLEKAKTNFHTEVIYSDPFSKTEAPAFLEPILKASGPEFSVAVGLALRQIS